MRLRGLLLVALLPACNSPHSLTLDGKTVTVGASAEVTSCPPCQPCASTEPPTAAAPVPPLPPEPIEGPGINWWINVEGDAGVRGLHPGGGPIPLGKSAWRCEHSKPDRAEYAKEAGPFEMVSMRCEVAGHTVSANAICHLERGRRDTKSLTLDGLVVTLGCFVK